MVQAAHGALYRTQSGPNGLERQCDLQTGKSAIDMFWKPMISRGCLRASGGRNYWGIPDVANSSELKRLLESPISPLSPPDVSQFSNYEYVQGYQPMGMFLTPGLDEELAFGKCQPQAKTALSRRAFKACKVLQTKKLSAWTAQETRKRCCSLLFPALMPTRPGLVPAAGLPQGPEHRGFDGSRQRDRMRVAELQDGQSRNAMGFCPPSQGGSIKVLQRNPVRDNANEPDLPGWKRPGDSKVAR